MDHVQGDLWDVAWSADGNYIAASTRVLCSETSASSADPARATTDTLSPSMLYYWRRDGSLMCSMECSYDIAKLIVDPGNSAYIVTLGTSGKVHCLLTYFLIGSIHQATTFEVPQLCAHCVEHRH
jgi:hypothetical protein